MRLALVAYRRRARVKINLVKIWTARVCGIFLLYCIYILCSFSLVFHFTEIHSTTNWFRTTATTRCTPYYISIQNTWILRRRQQLSFVCAGYTTHTHTLYEPWHSYNDVHVCSCKETHFESGVVFFVLFVEITV